MPKRYKISRIKANRSYEIEEAALVLGVTPQTIRQWIKQGLPALTERRPFLILGWQLIEFLKMKRKKRARPLGPGEFYCTTCQKPRRPDKGIVEVAVSEDGRRTAKSRCEVCGKKCNLFVPTHTTHQDQLTA